MAVQADDLCSVDRALYELSTYIDTFSVGIKIASAEVNESIRSFRLILFPLYFGCNRYDRQKNRLRFGELV